MIADPASGDFQRRGRSIFAAVSIVLASCAANPGSSDAGPQFDGGADAGIDAGVTSDAGDPQRSYTYPGCTNAQGSDCPNSVIFACALHTIEARHNTCANDSDCVAVPVQNCVGVRSSCPPAAVNRATRDAFESEARTEVWSYCGDAGTGCMSAASCAYWFSPTESACENGRCIPLFMDGGRL